MQTRAIVRTGLVALTVLSTGVGLAANDPGGGDSRAAVHSQPEAPAAADTAEAAAKAYAEALAKDTSSAFEAFLAAYPDAPEAADARDRMAWRREDEDYRRARAADDEEGYRAFLRDHPQAVFREEVELRIQTIVDRKAEEQAKERAEVEAARRRRELLEQAVALDTAAAYRLFLAAFPGGPEAQEAERRLADLEADDSAYAEARTTEEGLKAYLLERPEGRNAADARARLQALASPPQAAPTPSAAAFQAAQEKRSAQALEEFLAAYPGAAEAAEARERLEWLREDDAYGKARAADTEEGYRAFLRDHPKAVLREEVELRLNALVDRKARDQAAQEAQAEADRRRREAYAAAEKLGTAEAYGVFLAVYPDAPEAADARSRRSAAEADDAAFAEAAPSEAKLEAYLAARPQGAHAAEARERLEAAKRAASAAPSPSAAAFAEAQQTGAPEALEAFLKAFPEAPEAEEARRRFEQNREDAAYEAARAADTEEGYRAFLWAHPRAARRGEVELRLAALADRRARDQAAQQARDEADRRRRQAYEAAERLDTATAYGVFLAVYPDTPEAAEAARRMKAAEARERLEAARLAAPSASAKAYAEAGQRGTAEAFESFLAAHPEASEAPEARRRVAELREDAAYERARATDDEEGYRAFLAEYPRAARRGEVELRLAAIADRRARDEAAQQGRAEADRRRREAFAAAERLGTATAYGVFLAVYPDAPEAAEARRRTEAAEADDAAFAGAARSEEALEAYLAARPQGAHAAEAREQLEAVRRTAAAAPSASAAAFAEAQQKGTRRALESFVAAFPETPEAVEARRRLEKLREDADYEAARAANGEEGYRAFLSEHPQAARRGEVELRLRALEDARARAVAEERAATEAHRRRREALEAAKKLDTAAGYAFFLTAYPDAPEAPDVRRRLDAAEADDAAYAAAGGSAEGLQRYLAARPEGRHVKQAREGLLAIRNAASEGAFNEAVRLDLPAALESFLKAYPDSPRAPEARAALAKHRRSPEPPAPAAAAAAPPVLVASFVAAAPVSDGRADDRAWQGAQELEVPLKGGRGPRSVRLKAVHDGHTAHLLAQWADPTGDAANRPWVWDASQKTYVQQERQLDDGFLLLLHRGSASTDSRGLEADAWLWRANDAGVSGLAEDGWMRMGGERLPKARAYPTPDGGHTWARYEPDAGSPSWSFYLPSRQQGPQVSSRRRARAAGSRSDAAAVATWRSGVWTLELARALDTGHADDVALRAGGAYGLSVGVFDRAEEAPQVVSGVVRLELRGPQRPGRE